MKQKEKYIITSYDFFKNTSTYYFFLFFHLLIFFSEKHLRLANKIRCTIYSSILVSVIMPIYNKLIYLNASMSSIQSQTLYNIEIICIDDFFDRQFYRIYYSQDEN